MINDKIVQGAVAGTMGAAFQNIYGYAARLLGMEGPIYIDYGKLILFPEYSGGTPASVLGIIGHFVWDIFIGIIFVYLADCSSNHFIYIKGIIYGLIIWFLVRLGATLYKIPIIIDVSPETVTFFLFGALLYGVVLSYVVKTLKPTK